MNRTNKGASFWTIGIVLGAVLTVVGVSAGYIDVSTHFRFDFVSEHFDVFLGMLIIGLAVSFVAVIG